jgi:hypothetical protein
MAKIIEFYVPIKFRKKADRATTKRQSDTLQFTKKEVGLTKTILLLVNNRFVRASATRGWWRAA